MCAWLGQHQTGHGLGDRGGAAGDAFLRPMDVSRQFATSPDSPEHIAVAELSGYHRAWLHDTPAQSPDVWAVLAQAAERTHRIGLAPGVLAPMLRHPMVNASGVATLAALAPGRAALAFGTGFNGTRALGAPSASWSYLSTYVRTVRGLLRGDTVEWDGARMRMLHPPPRTHRSDPSRSRCSYPRSAPKVSLSPTR